jgi:hypothetical protein
MWRDFSTRTETSCRTVGLAPATGPCRGSCARRSSCSGGYEWISRGRTGLLRIVVGSTRTLDSHASRLRRKLAGSGRRWIVNVWGVGYRLTDRIE